MFRIFTSQKESDKYYEFLNKNFSYMRGFLSLKINETENTPCRQHGVSLSSWEDGFFYCEGCQTEAEKTILDLREIYLKSLDMAKVEV